MIETIIRSRDEVVTEARTWIDTPYHTMGRVKGAGADCFTFIAEVMIWAALFLHEQLPPYQGDWWANVKEDEYRKLLLRHSDRMYKAVTYPSTKVLPGNIIAQKRLDGKVLWHAAIVTKYPFAIHAVHPKVEEIDVSRDSFWCFQEIEIFDPWERRLHDRR